MNLNRFLEVGRGWLPCKTCGLPCIISDSGSVNGGTISHGCAHCVVQDRNRLLDALKDARQVLVLCSTRRFDAPEDPEVGQLGARLGYGAVMSAASKEWAKMFDGTPQAGAQHTSGPCETTVRCSLDMIDKALTSSLAYHAPVEMKAEDK